MELDSAALIKKDIKEETCQGLVFRAAKGQFYSVDGHNRIIWTERINMRQIKKLSCPGCRHCGYLHEYLDEFTKDFSIDIRPDIESGALYSLEVVYIGRDWETGIIDDCGLAFVKLPPEQQK